MGIAMQAVKSSQIASIGYSPENKTLAIKFNNGQKVYHYAGVSQEDFDKFSAAESVGKHFGAHIRGKFPHTLQDEKDHGEAEKK
jgi:hypothetical protein